MSWPARTVEFQWNDNSKKIRAPTKSAERPYRNKSAGWNYSYRTLSQIESSCKML